MPTRPDWNRSPLTCSPTPPSTPRASGQIWFSAQRERNEIVIRVRDTGVGITPEQLASVFEPFVQGDRSLERSAGGLGIGLTLVRKLTELHGGTVMARSEGPGKGSEFTVRLPAASETVSQAVEPRSEARTDDETAARILVVDDNADLARGLARLLEIHGHQVHIAYDGPAGSTRQKSGVRNSCSWILACPAWTAIRSRPFCGRTTTPRTR